MTVSNLNLKIAVGMLIAITIIATFFRSGSSVGIPFNPSFYSAEGFMLGQAAAETVPDGGSVLVIHSSDKGIARKINSARLDGLRKALDKDTYSLQEVVVTEVDPGLLDFIPSSHFQDMLSAHPNTALVISFAGPPEIDQRSGSTKLPPIFCGEIGFDAEAAIQSYLRTGMIQAYIQRKANADFTTQPKKGQSLEDVFGLRYEIISQ